VLQLDVGVGHVCEGRSRPCIPSDQRKDHLPQPVHQAGPGELTSRRKASHGAQGNIAVSLEPPDLIDAILTTDLRVRPDRLLQGTGEDDLVESQSKEGTTA
jgi:hypothetical protein